MVIYAAADLVAWAETGSPRRASSARTWASRCVTAGVRPSMRTGNMARSPRSVLGLQRPILAGATLPIAWNRATHLIAELTPRQIAPRPVCATGRCSQPPPPRAREDPANRARPCMLASFPASVLNQMPA